MENVDFTLPSVFLAGPTVRGHQTHLKSWRDEAIGLFELYGFKDGNLIIPEFLEKTESDQYRYDLPVWEFTGLQRCHVIMFWIPRTRELIGLTTNHEHGYWLARNPDKVVYGHPHDAYRMTYLDIMWVEDAKRRSKDTGCHVPCPIYTGLQSTVIATIDKLKERHKLPY